MTKSVPRSTDPLHFLAHKQRGQPPQSLVYAPGSLRARPACLNSLRPPPRKRWAHHANGCQIPQHRRRPGEGYRMSSRPRYPSSFWIFWAACVSRPASRGAMSQPGSAYLYAASELTRAGAWSGRLPVPGSAAAQ